MAFELRDDGTLDTVLACSECGEEVRYNFDNSADDPADRDNSPEEAYERFVEWAIEDAEQDHECPESENAEPTEPEEDDITTTDHEKFYQSGKLVIEGLRKRNAIDVDRFLLTFTPSSNRPQRYVDSGDYRVALRIYMDLSQFWPNCWFISDHGNAHLITFEKE